MKKTVLVLILLSVFVLAACGAPATPQGVTTTGDDSDDDGQDGTVVTTTSRVSDNSRTDNGGASISLSEPFDLEAAGIADTFDIESIAFPMRGASNEFKDKSSLIRVQGSNSFEANMEITYSYSPTSQLDGETIFLKAVGLDTSGDNTQEVYTGIVEEGENTIALKALLPFQGGNVRINYCFGFTEDFDPQDDESSDEIYCKSNVGTAPDNKIGPSIDSFSISLSENDGTYGERDVFMNNDGSSDLTAYIYAPSSSDYELDFSKELFHLEAGDTEEFTVEATWTSEESPRGEALFYVYSLANNCNPSADCAKGARILNEVEINLRS